MPFSAADITAMLNAGAEMGTVTVTITNGVTVTTATGLLDKPGKVITQAGTEIETTEPVLMVDAATAATVTRNSTVLGISGINYQCFDKSADHRSGFTSLFLTEDY